MTARKPWADRGSRHSRGYDSRWDRLRLQILKRDHHLCQACAAKGRVTPATEVDHQVPKAQGGTDEPSNLAAICRPCHLAKTAEENGRAYRPKVRIGVSGWPAED